MQLQKGCPMNKRPSITFEIKHDGDCSSTVKTFTDFAIKVGSIRSAGLCLEGNSISRMHAYIKYEMDSYWLSDLGSSMGTFVNGQRVNKAKLENGDILRFGDVEVLVTFEAPEKNGDDFHQETARQVWKHTEPRVKVSNGKQTYYCEQCFHIFGELNVMEKPHGALHRCPKCQSEWKLNEGQARHVVSLKLQHYSRLANRLGISLEN